MEYDSVADPVSIGMWEWVLIESVLNSVNKEI